MKTHTTDDGTTLLLFLCAIALSATAAFYAVSGLVAIFAAAVIPIIVMGSMLEISKLVLASWLYRNWKETSFLLRTYFCVALTILMLLTSMGIFGYLSKAHLDQAVPTGDVAAKVAILDEKIKTERENVERARRQLQQMDSQVEQALARTTDDKGTERSVQIRRGQQKERSALLAEIGSAQTRIARLNEERAPISAELRKVEAEVGPLKYVAALLYGDNPDQLSWYLTHWQFLC
jgi:septal ring factor EnvC (AmiA/AmiB activator)